MRTYIIEMLGGVPSEVYRDAETERRHYTKNYYLMSDKAAKLEQTLNEKISEIGQLQEVLRISKAAVERVENEHANCSEGWTKANERVAEVIAERDALARKVINMPQRKYTLLADVRDLTNGTGKVTGNILYLLIRDKPDSYYPIAVRKLAASKKNKAELDRVASEINECVTRIDSRETAV